MNKQLNLADMVGTVAKKLGIKLPPTEAEELQKQRPAHAIAKAVGTVSAKAVNLGKRTVEDAKRMGTDVREGFLAGLKEGFEAEKNCK